MIIFYNADSGEIVSTSTWTLANPDTYAADGYLLIDGIGRRPVPGGLAAFPFKADASLSSAALIEAIQGDDAGRFTIVGGQLLDDGVAVVLDFTPGKAAASRTELQTDALLKSYFSMTDIELRDYVVANFGLTAKQAGVVVLQRRVVRELARVIGVVRK